MSVPKAYLITVREFVVIARDERDVREYVADVAREDHRAKRLTADELAREGNSYPCGEDWDPDLELSCAEIADAMRLAEESR